MEHPTIDQLIEEYRSCAAAHHEPNDGSPSWTARVNRAADRMLLISRHVASAGPDAVTRFADLLQAGDPQLSIAAAHHLLDFMEADLAARDRALAIIERAAQGESGQAAGERLWLDNWRAEQQDE